METAAYYATFGAELIKSSLPSPVFPNRRGRVKLWYDFRLAMAATDEGERAAC
jgi:hypothetical protein